MMSPFIEQKMADLVDSSSNRRTLAVVVTMHRSGSSAMANILERLGMSLGPFELLGASPTNRHGHFEAMPFYQLDQKLQGQVFGFTEDIPESQDVLRSFCKSEGRWNLEGSSVTEEQLAYGKKLVEQLTAAGQVSGFKDPRVPVLWPFWSRVFADFPDLRVVPVFLVRSPHEIAMSMFTRAKGRFSYRDALDVTAVSLKCLRDIRNSWPGEQVLVRFDPRVLADDMRQAAKVLGLDWSEERFREAYDPSDLHYVPTHIDHESQQLFNELSGLGQTPDADNAKVLANDAVRREKVLQQYCVELKSQIDRNEKHIIGLMSAVQDLADRMRVLEMHPIQRGTRLVNRVLNRESEPKR
jgi:hypothetical protein